MYKGTVISHNYEDRQPIFWFILTVQFIFDMPQWQSIIKLQIKDMIKFKYSFMLVLLMTAIQLNLSSQALTQNDPSANLDETAMDYAQTITETDLKGYLKVLASDALEGRETGTRGQKMAAAFIAQFFEDNGLLPVVPTPGGKSYEQQFALFRSYYDDIYLQTDDVKYQHQQDVLFFGDVDMDTPQEVSLRFVGEGEASDYQGLEVKGKGDGPPMHRLWLFMPKAEKTEVARLKKRKTGVL